VSASQCDDDDTMVPSSRTTNGKITLFVYPGNPRQAEFVRHLVKEGQAFPDLSEPGRWQMTPDR